jgi:NTP pyrophosphatase (non-canonical NTP hydrolase)
MRKIITDNYKSIVKRGLINSDTTLKDFIIKIEEELDELWQHYNLTETLDPYELADIILVCLNTAEHFNIDIEHILKEKITINQKRND